MNIPNLITRKKKKNNNNKKKKQKKNNKTKKKKEKEKRGGHIIECLLTELGRAGRENIICIRPWCTDLAAPGPYAMTSGQIFSRPALPLSQ